MVYSISQQAALYLHARHGYQPRALGPILELTMGLDELLTRFVKEVQQQQRHGRLISSDPPEVLARRLMQEAIAPGSTRHLDDHLCPEVW